MGTMDIIYTKGCGGNCRRYNQSVRERFGIDKNQSAVASRIIADTLDAKKIKLSDESITSKKYATYIPYYA